MESSVAVDAGEVLGASDVLVGSTAAGAAAAVAVPVLSGSGAAALSGSLGAGAGAGEADPLRREYDGCLDSLVEIACEEAKLAARKVRTVARCAEVARVMAAPGLSLQEQAAQEMALVAEVACVLTIREPAAAGLLTEARELTSGLPLTLSALEAGSISWQHARIMVDEASGLGPVGARALEAHFLGPEASNPTRGCPAGELVPGRFLARARTWRERHHPVSIEKRHAKCVTDRRVLFSPDRDGMAWL